MRIPILTLCLLCAAAQAYDPELLNRSHIAFTLPGHDTRLPENLAYDPRDGSFLIGSTRYGGVIRRHPDGRITELVPPGAGGHFMSIGLKVDAERRRLWMASAEGGNLEGWVDDGSRGAGVFVFDLDDGRPIASYVLDAPGEKHFFNDLVLSADGGAYVTHMFEQAAIYRFDAPGAEPRVIYSDDPDFRFPNGISLSADQRALYVAHAGGVSRIEISSGQRQPLITDDPRARGFDGLYLHRGDLVGVQDDGVRRLQLAPDGITVTAVEDLDLNHPLLERPTTGVLVDDTLYYIANAQFDSFTEDRELFPRERLIEPVVLAVPLGD